MSSGPHPVFFRHQLYELCAIASSARAVPPCACACPHQIRITLEDGEERFERRTRRGRGAQSSDGSGGGCSMRDNCEAQAFTRERSWRSRIVSTSLLTEKYGLGPMTSYSDPLVFPPCADGRMTTRIAARSRPWRIPSSAGAADGRTSWQFQMFPFCLRRAREVVTSVFLFTARTGLDLAIVPIRRIWALFGYPQIARASLKPFLFSHPPRMWLPNHSMPVACGIVLADWRIRAEEPAQLAIMHSTSQPAEHFLIIRREKARAANVPLEDVTNYISKAMTGLSKLWIKARGGAAPLDIVEWSRDGGIAEVGRLFNG